MPNMKYTLLTITGSEAEIDQLMTDVAGENQYGEKSPFDFSKIIPVPDGPDHIEDRQAKVWGTKWNAMEVEILDNGGFDDVQYVIGTANTVPNPVFKSLMAKYPQLEINWCKYDN